MIFLASDHAGFQLKSFLLQQLKFQGHEVQDMGTNSEESCDYPQFAFSLAQKVVATKNSRGILICGTGVGMSIAANKVFGARAACVSEVTSAQMAREHNDAQIICIGARILSDESAWGCVEVFLKTEFDRTNERHQRRINAIHSYEEKKS